MRIVRDSTVVVVIDVQERLLPVMDAPGHTRARIVQLLEGARELGVPVLATEQYPEGLGPTVADVRARFDAADPPIAPITKRAFSCMDEPSFAAALAARAPRTVVVAGIETHVCVLQTTLDLLAAGYRVAVVTDAVDSRNPRDHATALARMGQAGAVPTTVESILFELTRTSTDAAFRAVSRLVREIPGE